MEAGYPYFTDECKCPVCLETLVSYIGLGGVVRTPCQHYFHKKCLTCWIIGGDPGAFCPLCKQYMKAWDAVPVTPGDPLILPATFTLRKLEVGNVTSPSLSTDQARGNWNGHETSLTLNLPSVSDLDRSPWRPLRIPSSPHFVATPSFKTFGELAGQNGHGQEDATRITATASPVMSGLHHYELWRKWRNRTTPDSPNSSYKGNHSPTTNTTTFTTIFLEPATTMYQPTTHFL